MSLKEYNIGFLWGGVCAESDGKIVMRDALGSMIDETAKLFSKCYICSPVYPDDGSRNYVPESNNIKIIKQPDWENISEGNKHPIGIFITYIKLVDSCDVIFIRGIVPYLPLIYIYSIIKKKPIVQWMAGDLLESSKWYPDARSLKGKIRTFLAWLNEVWFKFIRKSHYVYMIASGCVLYEKYKTPRTTLVVSSTIKKDDFYYRNDTCQKEPIRILFLGYVRPGKGLKYLINALAVLKTRRQFQLAIVGGGKDVTMEKKRIDEQIQSLGLTNKISWVGYATFGSQLFDQLKQSDLLVLPTLSEGAPHVLIEARAFGLPCVSTNVGGIPSSIKNYEDGIMVPPAQSQPLAEAIDKVIDDTEFRQKLIANGYKAAERFCLENFIAQLEKVFLAAIIRGKQK